MTTQPVSIRQAFREVATHRAVLLSTGNTVLALATGNKAGAALQLAATGVIGARVFQAARRGEETALPWYLLGTINLATAAIGFGQGVAEHGLTLATGAARKVLLGSTALAGWGVGHLLSGFEMKRPALRGKNLVAYGAADIAAVAANPALDLKASTVNLAAGKDMLNNGGALLPAVFAAAGFARSVFSKAASKPGTFGWHMTPARLCGLGYLFNGIAAAAVGQDYGFAMASAFWTAGMTRFDPAQNRAIIEGVRAIPRAIRNALKR